MAAPLQPSIRVTLVHTLVPATEGTVTRRWASRPFADSEAWTEGRIESISPITRAASSIDGDYQVATCDVILTDTDGFFRGLLNDPVSRVMTAREAAVELLSEAGRAAELAWRPLLRGRLTDVQALPGRKARIRISDEVGSRFSGFDLEKVIGVPMTHAMFPNMPNESAERILPIVIGEHSDVGALDENGAAADVGTLPFIDVGPVSIGDDNSVLYDSFAMPRLPAPEGVDASVFGAPGSRTRTYQVTASSYVGETTPSETIEVQIPDDLGDTAYVDFSWDPVPGAEAYTVYLNGARAETIDADVTMFHDNGSSAGTGPAPPQTNTAFVESVVGGVTYSIWNMLVAKIGAGAEILYIYGSDLANGSVPKRTRLPESVYGDQVLTFGKTGWPHPDPFIERDGVRVAVIYARGPLLEHHKQGYVTFAWNGCGDEEVGDGTGNTITEAFYQLQHVINEYALKDGGLGYRTGTYGPLELFTNNVEKLKSSAFESAQDTTVEWIGGRGYQGAFAIVTPTSLREFLRHFAVTFACHYATDHHGQFFPFVINDAADPDLGRHYRDRIEVVRFATQVLEHDAVETRVVFHFDFNVDAQEFMHTDQVLEDIPATEAHGGVPRQRGVRQCFYTRDVSTAVDSNSRHLTRYKIAPRFVGIEVDYTGLEDEVSDQIRLTHYDGLGENGDVNTPLIVLQHTTNPSDPNTVILMAFDIGRISTFAFPALTDETASPFFMALFDETTGLPPPDGAYELR